MDSLTNHANTALNVDQPSPNEATSFIKRKIGGGKKAGFDTGQKNKQKKQKTDNNVGYSSTRRSLRLEQQNHGVVNLSPSTSTSSAEEQHSCVLFSTKHRSGSIDGVSVTKRFSFRIRMVNNFFN